jgi:hypothetical protein
MRCAGQETYYAAVYWGAQQETAGEGALRVARFLQALRGCDPSFQQWYRPGRGRTPRGVPGLFLAPEKPQEIEAALLEGRHYASGSRRLIEDLGFALTCSNRIEDATSISIRCGCYSRHPPNSCLVDFPSEGEAFERWVSAPVLEQVLTAMVSAWEPDWGVVTSDSLREQLSASREAGTFAGWLTYFSRRWGTVPPLPAPARIQPVGTQGTLLLLSPERLSADHLEHRELLSRYQRHLDKAGLLRPLEALPSSPSR